MTARPVAFLVRSFGSAATAAGRAAAIVAGAGLLALAANWAILLWVLPPSGALASGFRVLVFGIGFPIGWLFAAQPYAVAMGLRRFYRHNRDEVLSLIAGAIQEEAGTEADSSPDRWLRAVESLQAHTDRYPRAVRPLLRLGLRKAGIAGIETALRTGSGPVPVRIAVAVADRIESELTGTGGGFWLAAVGAANVLAYLVVLLLS